MPHTFSPIEIFLYLALPPITPLVQEPVILIGSTDQRALEDMCLFFRPRIHRICTPAASRQSRVWVHGRVWVHADHVRRLFRVISEQVPYLALSELVVSFNLCHHRGVALRAAFAPQLGRQDLHRKRRIRGHDRRVFAREAVAVVHPARGERTRFGRVDCELCIVCSQPAPFGRVRRPLGQAMHEDIHQTRLLVPVGRRRVHSLVVDLVCVLGRLGRVGHVPREAVHPRSGPGKLVLEPGGRVAAAGGGDDRLVDLVRERGFGEVDQVGGVGGQRGGVGWVVKLVAVEERASRKGGGGVGRDVCTRFGVTDKEGRAWGRDAGVGAPVGIVDLIYSYLCSRIKKGGHEE